MNWLAALLQTSDSFYPTGSYAHSFGLEGLIHEGFVRDRDGLEFYLKHCHLPALRQADLPLVAHAWRAFGATDWSEIASLSELSHALRSAHEARAASSKIGRQRAELLLALRRDPLAGEYLRRAREGEWPFSAAISSALEARVLGAPLDAALSSFAYSSIASVLAAAMKLLRIGQNASQALLVESLAAVARDLGQAASVPLAEIGWSNPWLDIAAARHETADARLFIS